MNRALTLRPRERIRALMAGVMGQRLDDVEARVEAGLAATQRHLGADGERPMAQVLEDEQVSADQDRDRLLFDAEESRGLLKTLQDRLAKLRPPSPAIVLAWIALALILLVGDTSFVSDAYADSKGWDLQYASSQQVFRAYAVALLISILTAGLGVGVTGRRPLARIICGFVLIIVAVWLAALRASADPDTSMLLAIFGFVLPIASAIVSGIAKHKLTEYWTDPARVEHVALTRQVRRTAARQAQLAEDLAENEGRRRDLAQEQEELTHAPTRHAREVTALKADARRAWAFGRWLAGRRDDDDQTRRPPAPPQSRNHGEGHPDA